MRVDVLKKMVKGTALVIKRVSGIWAENFGEERSVT
jgi:hypothetical protein